MLEQLVKLFATDKEQFNNEINKQSKQNINNLFKELLNNYFNDLNSSTLRELVTCLVAGYTQNQNKLGYDGVKTIENNIQKFCEVKPRNYITSKINSTKLNAGGNFTDFSWRKFKKYSVENPSMLVSGFVDGELIYILEFDFNNKGFQDRLKKQLENKFPEGDQNGSWLRSANFSFIHFKDYGYKKIYVNNNISKYLNFLTKELYLELLK